MLRFVLDCEMSFLNKIVYYKTCIHKKRDYILCNKATADLLDVETYEEAVRKQAALAEQARLKEQAAKEQENKAKSIKAK